MAPWGRAHQLGPLWQQPFRSPPARRPFVGLSTPPLQAGARAVLRPVGACGDARAPQGRKAGGSGSCNRQIHGTLDVLPVGPPVEGPATETLSAIPRGTAGLGRTPVRGR